MRMLEFKVNGQQLKRKETCDFSKIVKGSVNYLQAKFYFNSTDWDECKKAASFWVNGEELAILLDENDICMIPKEVCDSTVFEISVTGIKPGSDYKIVTAKTKLRQVS